MAYNNGLVVNARIIQALEKCDEQGHKIEHCIVVHHLPRLAVHGKNQPEHESPNKRKQYDYKVCVIFI